MTSSCFQAPPVIPNRPSSLAGFWKIKPRDDFCFLSSLPWYYPSNRVRTRKGNSLRQPNLKLWTPNHQLGQGSKKTCWIFSYRTSGNLLGIATSTTMPSIYNHEMCHHWLTARKMKGWPVSDETKLSNDFGLCASWGVEISISRLLSTFVNIAAPRSSIVNIFL